MNITLSLTQKGWRSDPGHVATPSIVPHAETAIKDMLANDPDALKETRKVVMEVDSTLTRPDPKSPKS